MKNLLILNNRRDSYSNLIWSIAIKNKWNTFRMVISDDLWDVSNGYNCVRFYGDTLTGDNLIRPPFKFYTVDSDLLEKIFVKFPEFTQRPIRSTLLGELGTLKEDLFVKPAGCKFFTAKVYQAGETVGNEHCKPDDKIYVQGIIKPINEIRCFVLNGKVLTASYYRKDGEFNPEFIEEVPKQVKDQVAKICKAFNIPWGIVLDFAQIEGYDGWIFLEANEAWASGLYDCDPNECFKVIIESQY